MDIREFVRRRQIIRDDKTKIYGFLIYLLFLGIVCWLFGIHISFAIAAGAVGMIFLGIILGEGR